MAFSLRAYGRGQATAPMPITQPGQQTLTDGSETHLGGGIHPEIADTTGVPQLVDEEGGAAAAALPAPNGAAHPPSDDEMSSASEEEVVYRQSVLDKASAEFTAAVSTGVLNENAELLFSDGTWRPYIAPTMSAKAEVEHHSISTPPPDDTVSVEEVTPKRRRAASPEPIELPERERPPTPPVPVLNPFLKRTTPPRSPRGTSPGAQAKAALEIALELHRVATAGILPPMAAPIGPPVIIVPIAPAEADSDSFSFLGPPDPDPVVARNESRLQVLEQAIRAAELHAQAAVDRRLEHEEALRDVVANANAAADKANRSRLLETAELERRLESERAAKHEKVRHIQVLASQTADLNSRLNELTAQLAVPQVAPIAEPDEETASFRAAFQRQTLALVHQQQVVDQLSATLATTQTTLLELVSAQQRQPPAVMLPWSPSPLPPKAAPGPAAAMPLNTSMPLTAAHTVALNAVPAASSLFMPTVALKPYLQHLLGSSLR